MVRTPCCSEEEDLNRGAWTAIEDQILRDYIRTHGEGKWRNIPKEAGLKRGGKSCRLRWLNYLRPDIKRGNISHEEEDLIIRLHKLLGNRWSLIAGRLPGRTDNEIKNYWNTTLRKKLRSVEQSKPSKNYIKKTKVEQSKPSKNYIKKTKVEHSSHTDVDNIKVKSEGCSTDDVETETQSSARTLSVSAQEIDNNQQNYFMQLSFGDISDSDLWKQLCHFDYSNEAEVGRRLPFDQSAQFSEEILNDWIANDSFR